MWRAVFALAAALPLEAPPESGGTWMVGACKLETIGPGVVAGVADARTLVLAGGRQVRLAGIEAGTGEQAGLASEELKAAVLGRSVVLRRVGAGGGRDGRPGGQ